MSSSPERCECECVNHHVVADANHDDDYDDEHRDQQDRRSRASSTNDNDNDQALKLLVKLIDHMYESGLFQQLIEKRDLERKSTDPTGRGGSSGSNIELLKKDYPKPTCQLDRSVPAAVHSSSLSPSSSSSSKEKPLTTRRRPFTQKEKDYTWEKAEKVDGFNSDHFRVDKMGNLLYRRAYGKPGSLCSWEIDHSKCLKHGGSYHKNNIHAFQSTQNKAKGDAKHYDYKNESRKGISPEAYKNISTDVDKRCSLYKRDELLLRPDGRIDERSAAVQDGLITLNKDGTVRANCRAITNKELTFKKENNQPRSSLSSYSPSQLSSSALRPSSSSSSHITPRSTLTNASSFGTPIGYFSSNGSANGRQVFQGPRGGNFYLTASGNRRYI